MKNYWFIKLTFCNKKPWVSHWFLRHRAGNYSCGCNAHVCATFSVAVSTGLKTSVVIILVRNSLCSSPPRRGLAALLPPGLNAPGPDSANTVWGKNTVDVKKQNISLSSVLYRSLGHPFRRTAVYQKPRSYSEPPQRTRSAGAKTARHAPAAQCADCTAPSAVAETEHVQPP